MQYKLAIFDVDGTLAIPKSGETFRRSADDWKLLPGRIERLKQLKADGVALAIATNQGGVAFGHMMQKDIYIEICKLQDDLGIHRAYICYSHPYAKIDKYRIDDDRRKPGPGMLLEAMQHAGVLPSETLMVGDRPEDEEAAKRAGVAFCLADEFFKEK